MTNPPNPRNRLLYLTRPLENQPNSRYILLPPHATKWVAVDGIYVEDGVVCGYLGDTSPENLMVQFSVSATDWVLYHRDVLEAVTVEEYLKKEVVGGAAILRAVDETDRTMLPPDDLPPGLRW